MLERDRLCIAADGLFDGTITFTPATCSGAERQALEWICWSL